MIGKCIGALLVVRQRIQEMQLILMNRVFAITKGHGSSPKVLNWQEGVVVVSLDAAKFEFVPTGIVNHAIVPTRA